MLPEFTTFPKRRKHGTSAGPEAYIVKSFVLEIDGLRDVVERAMKIRASMIEKFPKLTNFDAMIIRGNARINTLTAGSRASINAPRTTRDTVGLAKQSVRYTYKSAPWFCILNHAPAFSLLFNGSSCSACLPITWRYESGQFAAFISLNTDAPLILSSSAILRY